MRWIETQALLFGQREQGGLGVEEYVEVGLGNAPTLANLGAKTLHLPEWVTLWQAHEPKPGARLI